MMTELSLMEARKYNFTFVCLQQSLLCTINLLLISTYQNIWIQWLFSWCLELNNWSHSMQFNILTNQHISTNPLVHFQDGCTLKLREARNQFVNICHVFRHLDVYNISHWGGVIWRKQYKMSLEWSIVTVTWARTVFDGSLILKYGQHGCGLLVLLGSYILWHRCGNAEPLFSSCSINIFVNFHVMV